APLVASSWTPVGAAVLVPVVAAGAFALFARPATTGVGGPEVTVTANSCGGDFTSLQAGNRVFTVVNKSGHAGDVYFTRTSDGAVLGEAEGIGPGTQLFVDTAVSTG